MPYASFIMAARNAEATIRDAIGSIRRQDDPDWELIVVDDGSADATADVAAEFEDPRIKVVRLPTQEGAAAARNVAVAEATGDVLLIADADDLSLPHRLTRTRDFFDAHPRHVVFSGQVVEFGDWGGPVQRGRFPVSWDEIHARALRRQMPLAHAASAIRASAFDGYDPALVFAEDFELFLRLILRENNHPVAQGTEDVLTQYRTAFAPSWSYWRRNARYRRLAVKRATAKLAGTTPPTLATSEAGGRRVATVALDVAWWLLDKVRRLAGSRRR